jgi:tetratricopeptide (TPR) repeat protein
LIVKFCVPVALSLALCVLPGCDRLFDKNSNETVVAADKKSSAGDFRGAIRLYEAALDGTSRTADVHYKLGLIYDSKLKEPADAVHHFSRYLAIAPTGSHAKDAKTMMADNERRLRTELTQGTPASQDEAIRLRNDNAALRKQLVELRSQKVATPIPVIGKTDKLPAGARTHVVVPGETLGTISLKYYKTKGKSSDLLDANYNQLGGKTTIKPGQKLIIP